MIRLFVQVGVGKITDSRPTVQMFYNRRQFGHSCGTVRKLL